MRKFHSLICAQALEALIHLVPLPKELARPSSVIVCIIADCEKQKHGKANSETGGKARRVSVEIHREAKSKGKYQKASLEIKRQKANLKRQKVGTYL